MMQNDFFLGIRHIVKNVVRPAGAGTGAACPAPRAWCGIASPWSDAACGRAALRAAPRCVRPRRAACGPHLL